MKTKQKVMTEEEIDRSVTVQAEDMSAWGKPVKVQRAKSTKKIELFNYKKLPKK